MCSSHTTEDFVAAEEDRGEGLDHNFFRYMCGSEFIHAKFPIFELSFNMQKEEKTRVHL